MNKIVQMNERNSTKYEQDKPYQFHEQGWVVEAVYPVQEIMNKKFVIQDDGDQLYWYKHLSLFSNYVADTLITSNLYVMKCWRGGGVTWT